MGFSISHKGAKLASAVFFGLCLITPPTLLLLYYVRGGSIGEEALPPFDDAPPFPNVAVSPPDRFPILKRWDASEYRDNEYITHFEEVDSIEKGVERNYLERRVPFIVRRAREMRAITAARLVNGLLRNRSQVVKGYIDDEDVFFPASEMLARWHAGQDVIVIDAPLPGFVRIPPVLARYNSFSAQTHSEGEDAQSETSVQLTVRSHLTTWHNDPPETGGGWVYSAEGEKHWIFLPPAYLHDVGRYTSFLEGATIEQLAEFARVKGLGKIHLATIRDGDFICWPPGWPHKVYTARRFIGLGSYMITPADAPDLARLKDGMMVARGDLDPDPDDPAMRSKVQELELLALRGARSGGAGVRGAQRKSGEVSAAYD